MSAGDNNSTRKLDVGFIKKPDGYRWVYADLLKYGPPHPRLILSFRDLHRIIQAIAICEDEKYPPPAKGRSFLVDFFRDAVNTDDFDALAQTYKIPEREGDRVVNTNGAKLTPSQSVLSRSLKRFDEMTDGELDQWIDEQDRADPRAHK